MPATGVPMQSATTATTTATAATTTTATTTATTAERAVDGTAPRVQKMFQGVRRVRVTRIQYARPPDATVVLVNPVGWVVVGVVEMIYLWATATGTTTAAAQTTPQATLPTPTPTVVVEEPVATTEILVRRQQSVVVREVPKVTVRTKHSWSTISVLPVDYGPDLQPTMSRSLWHVAKRWMQK